MDEYDGIDIGVLLALAGIGLTYLVWSISQ